MGESGGKTMMKYEKPELEVIIFQHDYVITTSLLEQEEGTGEPNLDESGDINAPGGVW